jgi:hypothetical protein
MKPKICGACGQRRELVGTVHSRATGHDYPSCAECVKKFGGNKGGIP